MNRKDAQPSLIKGSEKTEDERTQLSNERTLLAAERTFLAWIRTGLAGVAGGLAISRFIQFRTSEHQKIAQVVGQLLVLWGISTFIFALYSFRRTCKKLEHIENFQSAFWIIALIVTSLATLASILFAILLG